ncbi:MAG: thiol:disulfide interchange protein, partial [Rikenellaceae bacterium]|nr:thiol:disulfide interchange protein [Rikenellaceae bacterium]
MKRLALLFALCPLLLSAQVQWKVSLADKGKGEVELVATAMIDDGWHLYDVNIPDGGPNATTLSIDELKGAEKVGPFRGVDSHLHKEFDAMFDMEIGYYEDKASFAQRFKVTDRAAFRLRGDIRAQACNDTQCTPPLPVDFDLSAKDLPATVIPQTDKTAAAPAP